MQLRTYDKGDASSIQALFKIAFGGDITPEWLSWKYERSTWGAKGYVALDEGNVVAFYGIIKFPFSFNGKTLWAYQHCDVMTHPQYRARFFSKTPLIAMLNELLYRENDMDFAFGFPSLRHTRLQVLRLGGEGYRFVRLYVKDFLTSASFRWRFRVFEGWDNIESPEFNNFLTTSGKGSLTMLKNKEYLKWRYMEHPQKHYRLLTFERFNKLKGCVVFGVEDGWVNVLEVFYGKDRDFENIMASLEHHIKNTITECKGIKAWFHHNEPVINILGAMGYKGTEHIPVTYRTVIKDCGLSADVFFEGYFYRMGDYDAA